MDCWLFNVFAKVRCSYYEGSRIVHQELLSTLKERIDKTVVISQVQGAFDETYMSELLKSNGNIWLYMDALTEEHRGNVINRFCDGNGLPLKNAYFSGHTAAAVKELREAKIYNAFMNLRMVLDGEVPSNLVNTELCKEIYSDVY